MITHGWPGSIVEFHKVIEPLTASRAFTWCARRCRDTASQVSRRAPGWGVGKIAEAWETLMGRLGYERYGAQGGDWGAAVTTQIGRNGGRCVAIHLNMPLGFPPADMGEPTDEEQQALERLDYYQKWDSGYSKQQSTRPQTLGLRAGGLTRRAAGVDRGEVLVVDGLRRPSGERAHPRRAARQRDAVLGDRVGGLVGAAVLGELQRLQRRRSGEVPTGVAAFPREIIRAPRSWCEPTYNITHWTTMPRGGHFAAFEQPELFVDDVRAFFATVR